MKLKTLLFGALVGVAFAACTSDDDLAGTSPVKGSDEVASAQSYMALKFVMPGDNATTRAWNSDFEAADATEIAVSGATILFFDGETQVADPFVTTDYDNGWSEGTGHIDMEHEAIIVLKNAIKDPTSIVAILNALPTGVSVSRSTTMTQLLALTADFRKADAKNFVMTNSVFVSGTDDEAEVQVGTPVTSDNVQKTADLAKANPVSVAVEKIVAKATLENGEDTDTGVTTKPETGETTGKKISVTVNGWWLDSTNPASYLVKNLETSYDVLGNGTWWNEADKFRSYWATALAMDEPEHSEYKDAVTLDKAIYALENTDQTQPTILGVAATLSVEGAEDGESIVKYLSDVYTASDFETLLYSLVSEKYYTRTGAGTEADPYVYTGVKQNAFSFAYATNTSENTVTFNDEAIKDYEAVVSMTYTGSDKLYTYNGTTGTEVPEATYKADFASLSRKVQYWDGGATYYYTPIVHNSDVTVGTGDAAHKLYGIIRNHLYKITINSITGMGTPVANTNSGKEIIPEIPEEEETYIAAEIKILKYKVVEQAVNLGGE